MIAWMRPALAGTQRRSRGQAMVEFALVAPLLFVVLLGIFEAGRFVLNLETLNNATREGARYAIVHGAQSACPSGPMPLGRTNPCDPSGSRIVTTVEDRAIGIADEGNLTVPTPRWTLGGSAVLPSSPLDPAPIDGDNGRGNYVTVFASYSYDPILKAIFDIGVIPTITINAESTLVINT